MLVLVVHNHVRPGRESFVRDSFLELEAASRQEPGCLFYAVQQAKDDPREFLVYEQYRDDAALEAHRATPHYKLHVPKIAEACISQTRKLYQTIGDTTASAAPDLIAD